MASHRKHYLDFEKGFSKPGAKTDFYYVNNKVSKETIGAIFWYSPFRKYVWQANQNIVLDANCLIDIHDFLNQLMEERKIEKA